MHSHSINAVAASLLDKSNEFRVTELEMIKVLCLYAVRAPARCSLRSVCPMRQVLQAGCRASLDTAITANASCLSSRTRHESASSQRRLERLFWPIPRLQLCLCGGTAFMSGAKPG